MTVVEVCKGIEALNLIESMPLEKNTILLFEIRL